MESDQELECRTRRLIPTGRDSTLQQTFPNPCRRFHRFNLSFARHCRSACPILLSLHQFPWPVLTSTLFPYTTLFRSRIDACIQIIGVPNVKPAVRILQDIDPEPKTEDQESTRLKWSQIKSSNVELGG